MAHIDLITASLATLEKRADDDYCWGYNCSNNSSWEWARWLLFILFIALIISLFFGTRRVNKFRGRKGQAPIRGTAWITPPSYFQSQQQYNQPVTGTAAFVPPYTADVNPNDAGYYDREGVFHPNTNDEPFKSGGIAPVHYSQQPPNNESRRSTSSANFATNFDNYYQSTGLPNTNTNANTNANANTNTNNTSPLDNNNNSSIELGYLGREDSQYQRPLGPLPLPSTSPSLNPFSKPLSDSRTLDPNSTTNLDINETNTSSNTNTGHTNTANANIGSNLNLSSNPNPFDSTSQTDYTPPNYPPPSYNKN